jgi:large subunit ribosomal protein L10
MSKEIKQMQMDALKKSFANVHEYVLLSVKGLTCQADHGLRAALRKKNIRVQMVKNSLARRVFGELGMDIGKDSPYWAGTTWMAFGPESVAELSKEIDTLIVRDVKLKDKVTIKGAIAEGQPLTFEDAKKRPTRAQAIGAIVAMILGPASQIASQIMGPASQIASQIQTISEKKPEAEAPAEPEAAPAPAAS